MKLVIRSALASALFVAACATGQSVSSSPLHWPEAERVRLQQLERSVFPPAQRIVEGSQIVSGTLSPIAVHAGMVTLDHGGTAADAAVTVALTQVVTSAGSVVSYAGAAQVLYYDAQTRRIYVMDAGWDAYAGEASPLTIPSADLSAVGGPPSHADASQLGRQTLVPGFMAGLESLNQRFGRLPFRELFQPAIWYARQGITVSPLLASYFSMRHAVFARTAEGRLFLNRPQGAFPQTGERFVQAELADFLTAVADNGASYMYTGPWAHRFVDIVRAEGGSVTLEDLSQYRPIWTEPQSTAYGDDIVFGPGPTNISSCQILESLNLIGHSNVDDLGSYWTDPRAFRLYSSALKFAQFAHYLPATAALEVHHNFASDCPTRLTSAYATAMAAEIEHINETAPAATANHHSASVVVVDRWGNVAALIHSGNSVIWGETGIVVQGVPIPAPAAIYQYRLAALNGATRLPSEMSPVIVLHQGKPVLAVATIGVSTVPETVRLVAGLARDGEDVPTLLSAPPLLLNTDPLVSTLPLITGRPELVPENAYSQNFRNALTASNVPVRQEPAERVLALRGTASVVIADRARTWTVETTNVMTFGEAH